MVRMMLHHQILSILSLIFTITSGFSATTNNNNLVTPLVLNAEKSSTVSISSSSQQPQVPARLNDTTTTKLNLSNSVSLITPKQKLSPATRNESIIKNTTSDPVKDKINLDQKVNNQTKNKNITVKNDTKNKFKEIMLNTIAPKANVDGKVNQIGEKTLREKRRANFLHSNLDDLLNQRQRRALRFKRDSNYEDLLTLIAMLNTNGVITPSPENSAPEKLYYIGKYDGMYPPVLDENAYEDQESNNPVEPKYPERYMPLGVDPLDLAEIMASESYKGPSYVDEDDQTVYPKVSHWNPKAKRRVFTRRSNYYDSRPFGLLPGQRRKRNNPNYDDSSFGRWGQIMERRSYYDPDDVQRMYPLAAMLASQNYGRYKRSPRVHQSLFSLQKAM